MHQHGNNTDKDPYWTGGSMSQPLIVQQPQQPVPTTTHINIITAQPSHRNAYRDWQQGLCSCHKHCSGCLLAYFCGPCYACCLSSDVGQNCCCQLAQCCFYPLCLCCLRQDARHAKQIQGDCFTDCLAACCCPCCTTIQIGREFSA